MTCQTCGRPAENGVATHWLGCGELEPRTTPTRRYQEPVAADRCEHDGCSEPKREGSGKGAPPKYCEAHSNPKNRK
jgi:hypothetical protein